MEKEFNLSDKITGKVLPQDEGDIPVKDVKEFIKRLKERILDRIGYRYLSAIEEVIDKLAEEFFNDTIQNKCAEQDSEPENNNLTKENDSAESKVIGIVDNLNNERVATLRKDDLKPEDYVIDKPEEFNLSERLKECSRCKEYPQVTEHIKEFIKRLLDYIKENGTLGIDRELRTLAGNDLID